MRCSCHSLGLSGLLLLLTTAALAKLWVNDVNGVQSLERQHKPASAGSGSRERRGTGMRAVVGNSSGRITKLPPNSSILVVGAATFSGFHITRILQRREHAHIIAVDDFKESMEDTVALKRYRARVLFHNNSISVREIDVCDPTVTRKLVTDDTAYVLDLTDAVDVPSQEVAELNSYLERNGQCHQRMLNATALAQGRSNNVIPLLYLSTSMLSGAVTPSYTENQFLTHFQKKEALATVFFRQYGVISVAVRTFNIFW
eukprot:gb/GECG01006903.1/.p1 GENE.gb/GECG01006903.1/~~gb/GECG01006903.1/.p1  ORF type:complete len:258 (+),score=25.40 gb/GECG01006903.1/:1-774(+)